MSREVETAELAKGTAEALFGLVKALIGRNLLSPQLLVEIMEEVGAGQDAMGSAAPISRRAAILTVTDQAEAAIKARAERGEPAHGINSEMAMSRGLFDMIEGLLVILTETGVVDRGLMIVTLEAAMKVAEREGGSLVADRQRPILAALESLKPKPPAGPVLGVIEGGLSQVSLKGEGS